MTDIIIIGGGPAGMMAAISAASNGASVIIIEKNRELGKKLLITGKGRCNVTNNCDERTLLANVNRNPKFLYSSFYRFSAQDTISFFENLGVALKTERGQRVFPTSDRSVDIRDALKGYLDDLNVKIVCDEAMEIITDEKVFIKCAHNTYTGERCIIATGGLSYSETGSTGDGYRFARKFGHKIVETKPSLVGLKSDDKFCSFLSGLTLKNIFARFYQNDRCVYEDFGEFLFTHVGVSGPIVLSASAHFSSFENAKVVLNFKPALTKEQIDARLLRDFSANFNKDIINALEGLLPKRLLPILLERVNIAEHTKVHQITKVQREEIVSALISFEIHLSGKEGIKHAIITSGGVCVSEVSPQTMCSKLNDKIYFAGEVLDVDAYTGGFNLQIAFSTGYVAGMSATEGLL